MRATGLHAAVSAISSRSQKRSHKFSERMQYPPKPKPITSPRGERDPPGDWHSINTGQTGCNASLALLFTGHFLYQEGPQRIKPKVEDCTPHFSLDQQEKSLQNQASVSVPPALPLLCLFPMISSGSFPSNCYQAFLTNKHFHKPTFLLLALVLGRFSLFFSLPEEMQDSYRSGVSAWMIH